MAQLIPVDHDPFDMAASLAAAGGGDPLVPPPRNPMAPPQGLVDALSGAVKKNLDWASVPGRVARGVEPETPGQWSEEDEFRRQHLASSPYEWGPQTAFGEVFWPRTGTNVGGSGFNVGSGAIIPPKQGIRAYHGSPHDFDRFDLSKIGSGEGAQSYGHGLYFAENPMVAGSYRDSVGNANRTSPEVYAFFAKKEHGANAESWLRSQAEQERSLGSITGNWSARHYDEAADLVRNGKHVGGRMYEVNISAKPEQFLDWDRPLARQPIADTVRGLVPKDLRKTFDANVESGISGSDAYHNYIPSQSFALRDAGLTEYWPSSAKTFEEALQLAGGDPSRVRTIHNPSKSGASEALREAGIPGIKYLDQGSRKIVDLEKIIDQSMSPDRVRLAKQELEQLSPSSNYVVFDDKIIDILHKYGIGGLSMLPPAVAAHVQSRLIPVDHDPFAQ